MDLMLADTQLLYFRTLAPIFIGFGVILTLAFAGIALNVYLKSKKVVLPLIFMGIFAVLSGILTNFWLINFSVEKDVANLVCRENLENKVERVRIPLWRAYYYTMLGSGCDMTGKTVRGIELYEKAHDLAGDYTDSFFNILGLIYMREDNYDKAIEVFSSTKSYALTAKSYALKKDYNSALEEINKVIEKDSLKAPNYALRGLIYYNLGKTKEAKADCKTALEGYNGPHLKQLTNYCTNYKTALASEMKEIKDKYKARVEKNK